MVKEKKLADIILPAAGNFKLLISCLSLITVFFAHGMGKLTIENDIMFMLPDSNREKTIFMDTQETFGSTTGIVISIGSEKGILDPLLPEKLQTAGNRILKSNQTIPARLIEKKLGISLNQALVLTAFLQNLAAIEGKDFIPHPDLFADTYEMEENLRESIPFDLYTSINTEDIRRVAGRLSERATLNPDFGKELMGIIHKPTDNRDFNKGIWVDQISSIMESDTVWPEFSFFDAIDSFFENKGFADTASGRRLASLMLEKGLTRPESIGTFLMEYRGKGPETNIAPDFFRQIREQSLRDPAFITDFHHAMAGTPKQIRTGRIFNPETDSPALLRERLQGWSLFKGTLYSSDEKATLLFVKTASNLNKENKALLLGEVSRILEDVFGDTDFTYHMAGEPVVDNEIGTLMIKDITWLFPVVSLVVITSLFLMFRNLPGVLYPMLTVLISLVWCFGLMGYAGIPVSIVSSALPVLLVAVGTAYAIHLTHAFQQGRKENPDPNALARRVLNLTGGGVLMAGLTTMAGFASLAVNRIIPLRDFGIFISLGIAFALILALLIIPAFMLRSRDNSMAEKKSLPARKNPMLSALSLFSCRKPKTVTFLYLAVFAVSITGAMLLRVEMNNITFFKKDAPIRMADTFINDHFAGTSGLTLILSGENPGDALNPEIVALMEKLSRQLLETHPEIGKIVSPADFIKKMNQAFFDNDPSRYRLPQMADLAGEKSPEALHAQYEAYMDKYQRRDTRSLMDSSRKEAALGIQMKTACSTVVREVTRSAVDFLQGPGGQILRDKNMTFKVTGPGTLYLEANQLIVKGQIGSIAISFFLVFFVVARLMKSFIYGFFSLIPLAFTITVTFGIMGFAGIALDVATAITACVAIGIGIDYGIHYLVHYRDSRSQGLGHIEAILHTAQGTGKAIFFNATAVTAGFLVLLASAFIPLINLGILISITMICSALAAMTLLPAALTLAESRLHKIHEAGRKNKNTLSEKPSHIPPDQGEEYHAA
ncbi:efflux RND transporter permease subunit [Desulfobotulus mexicanus]|uniref:RND family transporter n=1 Tax=Desulfobotulus mexicanus TaxID=2586642 RepID=A0A5Q4VF96_9BACT|nr:MMPL family transporter [Desulfobotulus mexicanus]TYT74840.1 RND family transporter [Desulfobotulus mexicanus]